MREKQDYSEIHPHYGVPKEDLSCSGCGKLYKGKVCLRCEECKKCCQERGLCKHPHYIPASEAKEYIAEYGGLPPCPD